MIANKKGKKDFTTDAPEAVPFEPPSFEIDSPDGYKFLEEHGYAVFKNVLSQEEVLKGRELAWDFLEQAPESKIKRDDPKTWDYHWPDPFGKGIIVSDAVGQSSFLWYVRGIPKVSQVYKTIWSTDRVVTSFDGFCMHRPFEYNSSWLTKSGWYHVDQNGTKKPHKICVQGLVNFYDSGPEDGGLVVVPDSIHIFNDIFKTRAGRTDFVVLHRNDEKGIWRNECRRKGLKPIKVCAKAGEMIVWDSRTIHCNAPATKARELPTDGSLLEPRRLVAYVCMTPLKRLTRSVAEKRKNAYYKGDTTSHWPEECNVNGRRNVRDSYSPIELTEEQKALIPMEFEEYESEEKN